MKPPEMAAFLKGAKGYMEGQEEKVESQGNLELDTDILQKQEDISTSLCDRFGIHMYTEEFLEKEKGYQEKQEEKRNEIFHNVLYKSESGTTEEAFHTVMNTDTTEVIKAEYKENNEEAGQYVNLTYGIAGALLAGIVLFFIERYRRKRNENHYNYQKRTDGKRI